MTMTEEADKILAANRKPHRIFIFNIDSEIRSVCYPNYRRNEQMKFEEWKKRQASSMSEQPMVCLCQGVCSVYQEGFKLANNACPLTGCKHDTRSRPHPAPEQCQMWMPDCKYKDVDAPDGAVPCDYTDCRDLGREDARCEGFCKLVGVVFDRKTRDMILDRLNAPFTPETIREMQEIRRKHTAAIARNAREKFVELIEDKLPRYPSSLGDMYLLSDIQELAQQQAGEQP